MIRIRSAFTFVEILVLVATIIVMAAFLLPVLSSVQEKSRQTTCISNQHQLYFALETLAQDNKETFPGMAGVADGALWQQALAPSVASTKVWRCPSSTREQATTDYGLNYHLYGLPRDAMTDPAGLLALADAHKSLIQMQDDIAARHAGSYIATFADGHSRLLTSAGAKIMFHGGDEGTVMCFSPEFTPITFTSAKDAGGKGGSIAEGKVVVLTNNTSSTLLPLVTVFGGDTPPAKGLLPGSTSLQIDPGQSRAFRLYCRTNSGNRTKADTTYTFGDYPNAVAITVAERVE